ETVELLERVSRRWGVSKSEALRRAIRASALSSSGKNPTLGVLDRLQKAAALDRSAAARWERQVRAERRVNPRNR
ncbi:MAG: hypothetical protein ACT4PM_06305, partial [Gemmatimonadales bacterium]